MADLGDGTYAVRFRRNNVDSYVRVDGDLPVWNGSYLAYADQSPNGSIWAAIIEKAYAFFRTGAGTYASLNSGWMATAFSDLGISNTGVYSTDSLLSKIDELIKTKKAVTYATASVPARKSI